MYKLKEMIKSLSGELFMTIKEIDNLKLDVEIMNNYRSYNLFSTPYAKKARIKIRKKNKKKKKRRKKKKVN